MNKQEKFDYSKNCNFDDDSGKNDCWHCIHFLFPIGCMYGEEFTNIKPWISTKEKQPCTSGVYNVIYQSSESKFVTSCYFDGTDTWYHDVGINHDRIVTDKVMMWQPLPEFPKDLKD